MTDLAAIDTGAAVDLLRQYIGVGEVAVIIRTGPDGHFQLIAHNTPILPVLLRWAAEQMDANQRATCN